LGSSLNGEYEQNIRVQKKGVNSDSGNYLSSWWSRKVVVVVVIVVVGGQNCDGGNTRAKIIKIE
jgi:hypothetical protein